MIGNYNGGKGNLYQHLINLMPPHDTYIEAYLGGGSVMLHKRPSALNVGIDMDGDVIEAWHHRLAGNIADGVTAPPNTAIESSIAACSDASATQAAVTITSGDAVWRLIHGDALAYLRRYSFNGRAFIYADPPYLFETRSNKRPLYRHEYAANDHIAMLTVLQSLNCMVMISGYWSELYADTLTGWHVRQFQAYTRSNRPVTEYVWMNYAPPVELHDYRYLGSNFRERERIKRKASRWATNWQNMPTLERQAILSAINQAAKSRE